MTDEDTEIVGIPSTKITLPVGVDNSEEKLENSQAEASECLRRSDE